MFWDSSAKKAIRGDMNADPAELRLTAVGLDSIYTPSAGLELYTEDDTSYDTLLTVKPQASQSGTAFRVRNTSDNGNIFAVDPAGATAVTMIGNVSVTGDMNVTGDLTTSTSTEVNLGDAAIILNSGLTGAATPVDTGIIAKRITGANTLTTSSFTQTGGVIAVTTDPSANYSAGDFIFVTGSDSNDGLYQVATATTGPNQITIDTSPSVPFGVQTALTDETIAAKVDLSGGSGGESDFLYFDYPSEEWKFGLLSTTAEALAQVRATKYHIDSSGTYLDDSNLYWHSAATIAAVNSSLTINADEIIGNDDGTGLVIGHSGTGASEGSTLQLHEFASTTIRDYLVEVDGMLAFTTSEGLQVYDSGWKDLAYGEDIPTGSNTGEMLYWSAGSAWATVAQPGDQYDVLQPSGASVPTWGNDLHLNDSASVIIGVDSDLTLTSTGAAGSLTNTTGDLTVENTNATGDVVVKLGDAAAATNLLVVDSGDATQFSLDSNGQADFTGNVDANAGLDVSGGNLTIANTYDILPITAGGSDLGSTSAEFGSIYVGDETTGYLYFGADQNVRIGYDETTYDALHFERVDTARYDSVSFYFTSTFDEASVSGDPDTAGVALLWSRDAGLTSANDIVTGLLSQVKSHASDTNGYLYAYRASIDNSAGGTLTSVEGLRVGENFDYAVYAESGHVSLKGQDQYFELHGGASSQYYLRLQASASQTQNVAYTMPVDDGTAGQFLSTSDGSGTLAWATPTGTVPDGTDNGEMLYWNGSSWTILGESDIAGQVIHNPTGANGTPTWTSSLDLPGTLDVTGNTTIDSDLTVIGASDLQGDVNLGDGVADSVTVSGRIDSNLIPATNNTYDIGDDVTPLRWADGYFQTTVKVNDGTVSAALTTTALTFTGTSNNSVISADDLTIQTGSTHTMTLQVGDNTASAFKIWDGTQTWVTLTTTTGAEVLTVDSTLVANGNVDLGNATSDTITATGRFDSNLDPSAASSYDLGNSTQQWRRAYLDDYIQMEETSDPTNAANNGQIYTKDVSGITQLFYMDSAGEPTQLTGDTGATVTLPNALVGQLDTQMCVFAVDSTNPLANVDGVLETDAESANYNGTFVGVTLENIAAAGTGRVQTSGIVTTNKLAGETIAYGDVLYAEGSTDGTAGHVTTTPPTGSGEWVVPVGVAMADDAGVNAYISMLILRGVASQNP
jgi:hypothetical protein